MKGSLLLLVTTTFITVNNYGIEALVVKSMDDIRTSISVSGPSDDVFSSGILMSHTNGDYPNNWNRTFTLKAAHGCGIVIAIREIDLRPRGVDKIKIFPPNDTKSAFVISNPSLYRNHTYDSFEAWTLNFPGGQLSVNFETGGGSTYSYNGFEMTFTAYKTGSICGHSQFRCRNARCIAEDAKCNGHNNCGDQSDESNCTHQKTKGNTTAIAVGVTFLVIALICIIAIVIRRAVLSRSGVQTTVIHPPPYNPTGYHPS